ESMTVFAAWAEEVGPGEGPRLDYPVRFASSGVYDVWVRAIGTNGVQNSIYTGLNGGQSGKADTSTTRWQWLALTSFNVPSPGEHVFNLWMSEAGTIVDRIVLRRRDGNDAGPAPENGRAVSQPLEDYVDMALFQVSRFQGGAALLEGVVTTPTGLPWTREIVSSEWSRISGPGSVGIGTPGSLTTSLTDLATGNHTFRLMVEQDTKTVFKDFSLSLDSFQSWRSANGGISFTGDEDRDGIVNLLEYGLDSDPRRSEVVQLPNIEVLSDERVAAAFFLPLRERVDLIYEIEKASDPEAGWSVQLKREGNGPWEGNVAYLLEEVDGGTWIRLLLPQNELFDLRGFYRMRVTLE
ncbi:MAG: hypothetical protein AAF514_24050, partial [Verrucomicrobiota bacterium]